MIWSVAEGKVEDYQGILYTEHLAKLKNSILNPQN